ncbi:hypothetical protein NDU88_006516 [Pleurodeles waltl]|uniref:Uncharacterized protein n=1 Tax=Pleurodeles waltl TaxID=8319 RepID=A0AAV7SPW4_PLEWA|nr:hypothetical protein NDU88_006516 [Pleurodeles waltl]
MGPRDGRELPATGGRARRAERRCGRSSRDYQESARAPPGSTRAGERGDHTHVLTGTGSLRKHVPGGARVPADPHAGGDPLVVGSTGYRALLLPFPDRLRPAGLRDRVFVACLSNRSMYCLRKENFVPFMGTQTQAPSIQYLLVDGRTRKEETVYKQVIMEMEV